MTTSLCRIVTDPEILRDITWATCNCLVSWSNVGIWTSENPQTVTTSARSNQGSLLAVGYDSGHVSLYQHPTSQVKCGKHVNNGHSNDVSCVTFLADDCRLVSIGGKDCAILQWEIE